MVNKTIKSWRTIIQILIQTGYYEMYQEEVRIITDYLKDTGVEKMEE